MDFKKGDLTVNLSLVLYLKFLNTRSCVCYRIPSIWFRCHLKILLGRKLVQMICLWVWTFFLRLQIVHRPIYLKSETVKGDPVQMHLRLAWFQNQTSNQDNIYLNVIMKKWYIWGTLIFASAMYNNISGLTKLPNATPFGSRRILDHHCEIRK